MLNIIKDIIPKGHGNRPGRTNPMTYITIHNSGNATKGANAKAHADYLKSDAAVASQVSWQYTVDDICAYNHIPDNEDAWHAGDGSGSGNRKSIGIEICMNCDGDLLKATDNAAELTAMLCKEHNIPIGNIKQHCDWTGKNCPQMIRAGKPYNWNTFIEKVKKNLESEEITMTQYEELSQKIKSLDEFTDAMHAQTSDILRAINELSAKIPAPPMIYAWIDSNMPEWARPTIQKLLDKGYLRGDEEGKLNLDDNMLRMLVINDRAGIYDVK